MVVVSEIPYIKTEGLSKTSLRIDLLTVLTVSVVSVARVAGGGGHHSRCIVV